MLEIDFPESGFRVFFPSVAFNPATNCTTCRARTSAIGICAIILLTSGAAGAALGFLFALPRILTKDDPANTSSASAGNTEGVANQPLGKRLLGTNTNLEKVSDWLTTIIVGVGLTQLGSINDLLLRFRLFIADTAKVFPGEHGCTRVCSAGVLPSIAPMVLIFGLIMGFLLVYLYTRIIISGMLNKVESELKLEAELKAPLPGPAADAFRTLLSKLPGATENVAFAASSSGEAPSVAEGLELMGSLLYQSGRYQDVIDLAGQLVNTPAESRPEYWLYQAAAFGQKYTDLDKQKAPEAELKAARDNALNAARRAVGIDPSMKDRLWVISNPDGDDDDLKDLRSDPEFLKITGRWRRSPAG